MENATKGLLIAAAVLIVILIISLSLMVLNPGNRIAGEASKTFDELTVSAFNARYSSYEGDSVRGNQVRELIDKIIINNNSSADKIEFNGKTDEDDLKTERSNITASGRYKVDMEKDSNSGLINKITASM